MSAILAVGIKELIPVAGSLGKQTTFIGLFTSISLDLDFKGMPIVKI